MCRPMETLVHEKKASSYLSFQTRFVVGCIVIARERNETKKRVEENREREFF